MAETFALMDIGNVHFHHWRFYGGNGICNRNGSVRVSTGVQNNSVKIKANFLDFIDQFAFFVALKVAEFDLRKTLLQHQKIVGKRSIAVNRWFALAQ